MKIYRHRLNIRKDIYIEIKLERECRAKFHQLVNQLKVQEFRVLFLQLFP